MDRLFSFFQKLPRAVSLAARLVQSRASVEHTLAAHRFLKSIGYRGQARGIEALRAFSASGYTFDDLLMAFAFLRFYGCAERALKPSDVPEDIARANLRFAGWNACEESKQLAALSPQTPGLEGVSFCEDLLLGQCALVCAASSQAAAEACEMLRGSGVGGELISVDPAAMGQWKPLVESLARVRERLGAAGLELPPLRVVAVTRGDAGEESALEAAAELSGIPVAELAHASDDSARGFVEKEGVLARVCVTHVESLHLLALELRAARPAHEILMSFQPVSPEAPRVAKSGVAKESLVYVFPHIPKTAGSSVAHHFREFLNGRGEFAHVRHEADAAGIRRDQLMPFQWRDAELRARTRVIFGHGVKRRHRLLVPGKSAREIITLREPADRMVSHYNFWMHIHERRGLPIITFDEWYANEPRNYQVFWIAQNYLELDHWLYPEENLYDIVDATLEEFWMVSTLETFTRDMQVLMKELDLPEISERKNVGGGVRFKKLVSLTDDLRARLRAENVTEYRLYDKWLERARMRYT